MDIGHERKRANDRRDTIEVENKTLRMLEIGKTQNNQFIFLFEKGNELKTQLLGSQLVPDHTYNVKALPIGIGSFTQAHPCCHMLMYKSLPFLFFDISRSCIVAAKIPPNSPLYEL